MTRTVRPLAVVVTIAVLSAIGAGCGSSAPAGTGSTARATTRDKGVKFAECIRAHGVADFPDPDAKGDFQYGVSVSAAVWQRATTACKALQPPGTLSSKRTSKQQAAGLRFARCIRGGGVTDFPDPVNGEPLINTYEIPSSNRPGGMTILNAAIDKCRALLAEAATGR